MSGYAGTILDINLSTGKIEKIPVDEKVCRDYLGGTGLGAKIFFDRFPGDVDPLAPENLLIFMTGPMTGTKVPGGNRFGVCARSPLTGHWGEASTGGYFGPELKSAGYDGIIFSGASERPVYLWINGDDVEIRDASDLWGKNTYETTEILWERAKEETGKKSRVIAIGPSGEIGVKMASIVHDKGHISGRTGMGAVMGSKNLKAVSVVGANKKVEVAEPDSLKKWRDRIMEIYSESIVVESLREFGTNANLEVGSMLGDVPLKNWQLGEWDDGIAALNGPTYSDTILVNRHSCWGCPIGCKRIVKVDEEPYVVAEGPGPEYETVCMLGSNLLNDNLKSVAKANELCNHFGIDTISLGQTIAVVIECQEKGLLSPEECDGVEIKWGDSEKILKLIEMTALKKGFGARMAEGSKALALSIGADAMEAAVQVRGLELPAHDPRGFHGFAIAYATSVRGACHCASTNLYLEQGSNVPLPKLNLAGPFEEQSSVGKAYLTARAQELAQIYNSAVLCLFTVTSWDEDMIVEAFNSVTGFNYDLDVLMAVGERIWFLKRGIQILYGSDGKEDMIHPRLLKPVEEGPHAGSIPDFNLMKAEYYQYRQLDSEGRPSRSKLESLGLGALADMLKV